MEIEEIPQFEGTLQELDKLIPQPLTRNVKTFEDYLKEIHAIDYHGTDDDMPDAFEEWHSGLHQMEVLAYAESYGRQQERERIINIGRDRYFCGACDAKTSNLSHTMLCQFLTAREKEDNSTKLN